MTVLQSINQLVQTAMLGVIIVMIAKFHDEMT